jgi:DNA-binding IclR family transcriptional regulator
MTDETGRQLKTVNRTLRIIEALRELEGAGITELAESLDLSKGSVHHHLSTLRSNHLVRKEGEEYRLGLWFVSFGEFTRQSTPLYRIGESEVDDLAADTGEFVHLMTEQFGRAIHLYKAQGEQAVGKAYHRKNLQRRDYLHYSAAGKAILSSLTDNRVRDIIGTYGLPERTEQTVTSPDELFTALETVREQGYAVNDEEEIPGLRAVAAPIDPDRETVPGAISVSGPLSRMKGDRFERELPETVRQVANVIEVNIDTATE